MENNQIIWVNLNVYPMNYSFLSLMIPFISIKVFTFKFVWLYSNVAIYVIPGWSFPISWILNFLSHYVLSMMLLNKICWPWLVWLSGLSASLWTKGSPVWFLVRAHAWVIGQVPSRGHARGNHTLMFLSLSFYIPIPSL